MFFALYQTCSTLRFSCGGTGIESRLLRTVVGFRVFRGVFPEAENGAEKKKSAQCRCLSRVVCNYWPSLRIANESVCNCRRLRARFQLSEKQGNVTHVRKRDPAPTRLTGPATAPRSRLRHATSSMTFPRPCCCRPARQTQVARAEYLARSTRAESPIRRPGGCRTGCRIRKTRSQTRRLPRMCFDLHFRKCYAR